MKKQPTISEQFWKRVLRFPPILCRLLARHRYAGPFSTEELVQRSGLSHIMVAELSTKLDWECVDLFTQRDFTRACDIDFLNPDDMRRVEGYLAKRPVSFKYLRTSTQWETIYKPLLLRYTESLTLK